MVGVKESMVLDDATSRQGVPNLSVVGSLVVPTFVISL